MILLEGGNEFKSSEGVSVTKQNATTEEAQSVVKLMQKELGINLMPYIAGSIIYPDAETGDADVILDPTNYVKVNTEKQPKEIMNDFRVWLAQRLQKAGYQELPKKATVDKYNKYYKIAGDGLTTMAPIPGTNEWFQLDLDISEPGEGAFSVWSKRGEPNVAGTPKDSRAKGAYRHILKSAIASSIDPNWMWSYKAGLADRTTKQTLSKDPTKIAQLLFGPSGKASDLDNIQSILQKFKLTHPDKYNDVVTNVNAGLEKYKTQYKLQESYRVGTNEWFRNVLDRLK
jgi:hypothetical protein